MALKGNLEFESKKLKLKTSFENIMKDGKLDLDKKLFEIDKLLKYDNTIENIDFEYIKLYYKKSGNSNEDKKKILLNFECCIEENKFNNEFPNYKKKGYKKKIFDLLALLKTYSEKNMDIISKVNIIEKIILEKPIKFHNNAPINYNENLELYFYSLFFNFYKNILCSYENNFIKNNAALEEDKMKLTIEKTKFSFLNDNDKDKDQVNKLYEKKLNYLSYIYGTFGNFLLNLSHFICNTYDNFSKKFLDKQMTEEDILLFGDYLFFISNYQFIEQGEKYQFIWNNTFYDISVEEKKNIIQTLESLKKSSGKKNIFKIDNNTLYIDDGINQYNIDNINNYSFQPLIFHLAKLCRKVGFLELQQFLKIDKYMKELYIKKIWKVWEKFMFQVLTSKISQSLFEEIFANIDHNKALVPHNIFNENEIKPIINNIRYFIFDTNFYGLLSEYNLALYFDGDSYLAKNDELLCKILYLSENVKSNLHEIIGHLNIRIQYFLSNDRRFTSPKPNKPSNFAEERNGKESGEFVEELLFGHEYNDRLISQMLYILDINNYKKKIDEFRKEYLGYNKNQKYNISPEFKNFLLQVGIDEAQINFNQTVRLSFIHKLKKINWNAKFGKHPLVNKGYDDIYDTDY